MRMMTSKSLRRIGLALVIALPVIGLILWFWVIPAVIVAAIRERHEGYVRISGWWIGGSAAGVTGLELHEDPAPLASSRRPSIGWMLCADLAGSPPSGRGIGCARMACGSRR